METLLQTKLGAASKPELFKLEKDYDSKRVLRQQTVRNTSSTTH